MEEVLTVAGAKMWFDRTTEPVRCRARRTVSKVCKSFEEAETFFEHMSQPASNTLEIDRYMH